MKGNYACALEELRYIEGYCPDHFDENEQVQKECSGYIRDHYRTIRLALEGAVKKMSIQSISNTEILMFILGWQGGTIHQLADAMGVPNWRIMNATYDDMQDLMRLAQQKRAATHPATPIQAALDTLEKMEPYFDLSGKDLQFQIAAISTLQKIAIAAIKEKER